MITLVYLPSALLFALYSENNFQTLGSQSLSLSIRSGLEGTNFYYQGFCCALASISLMILSFPFFLQRHGKPARQCVHGRTQAPGPFWMHLLTFWKPVQQRDRSLFGSLCPPYASYFAWAPHISPDFKMEVL